MRIAIASGKGGIGCPVISSLSGAHYVVLMLIYSPMNVDISGTIIRKRKAFFFSRTKYENRNLPYHLDATQILLELIIVGFIGGAIFISLGLKKND